MKNLSLAFLALLSFYLNSCVKDPVKNLTEDESRIYVTNYDTTVSFSSYKTFKIADSIAIITNNRLEGRDRTQIDAQFIDATIAGLQQRGYVRVANDQTADLAVTLSAITNTNTQLVS